MAAIPDAAITDYDFHEKLGAGTYATVFRVTKKDSGDVCAIKCVEKSVLSNKTAEDNIITEIRLLKTLKHPHIVEMRDFLWDSKKIYIITEYCNAGDLSAYIRRRHSLPEPICKIFLRQLALALRYMREHEVSHFDLKPQNLLLCRTPGKYTLKVADFGFAQYLQLGEANTMIKGSLLYMAPEIILRKSYDAKADLWSVGVIFYECLFGRAPYRSTSTQELLEKVRMKLKIDLPTHTKLSTDCENLMRRLLRHEPADRISFEDFFEHGFIDLKHVPSEENFQKAAKLFTEAVTRDGEGKYREAYHLYCSGLKYFMPIVNEEADATKRQALRVRMNTYVQRAEEIKHSLLQRSNSNSTTEIPEVPFQKKEVTTTTMVTAEKILEPRARFKEVYKLSASSPAICHALDIGREAELFAKEKNLSTALDRYESALGSLVALLKKEPKGHRRDLLYAQITDWMEEAESIKALIEAKQPEVETTEGQERCSIQ